MANFSARQLRTAGPGRPYPRWRKALRMHCWPSERDTRRWPVQRRPTAVLGAGGRSATLLGVALVPAACFGLRPVVPEGVTPLPSRHPLPLVGVDPGLGEHGQPARDQPGRSLVAPGLPPDRHCRWRPAVPADSPRHSPCECNGHGGSPTPAAHDARSGHGLSLPGSCVLGACAAGSTALGRAADCAARRTGRHAWLRAVRAFRGRLFPCFVFVDASGRFGGAALSAWGFLIAPKATKTPRTSQGRPNLDPIRGKRERKQPLPCLREQTSAQGRGGQQGMFGMEKAGRYAALVPTMFSNVMKIKQTPPQREALDTQSCTMGADGEQVSAVSAVSVFSAGARGVASPEIAGPAMEGPAEIPSLEFIYHTKVHNHEQAQKESRKAKLANRQLQLSIIKVVKSCQDIGTRIASMETHTEELETEVKAAAAQMVTQGQQILDIQWKLEDAENRQRWKNQRILGIA
ncbi:hypothetical protein NDU88_004057 [Pleurodeles waltl]|uniref:Uncharacterized protein n=1 Tax=Pleurodeles waltl TaxID=8319 RepID=A0AAV7M843_PLEWA|nr:hypothetical protein NDU88_004057 [Pleurodeles waltl]